jgi:hypothetical protein
VTVSQDFGVSESRLNELVLESLNEWRKAFSSNIDDYYEQGELGPYSQIRIATQGYEFDCYNPMVNFQFGTLSTEQLTYFDDPRHFVGAAVRTEYDLKELKSKGFIYIAPLTGALKPLTKDMDPNAWTVGDNLLLKISLMHELGHIFGISHTDSKFNMENQTIMDVQVPELTISKYMVKAVEMGNLDYVNNLTPLAIIKPRVVDQIKGCGDDSPIWISDHVNKILGISESALCSKVTFKTFGDVDFYESDGAGRPWYKIGTLSPRTSGVSNQGMLIRIRLPLEQTVFTKLPDGMTNGSNMPLFGEILKLRNWLNSVLANKTTIQTIYLR